MGLGPIPASKKALAARRPDRRNSIDLAELNEAFAAQAIPCIDQLGLDPRRSTSTAARSRGATRSAPPGARLVLTLMLELEHAKAAYGLASMCIGVGQGIARHPRAGVTLRIGAVLAPSGSHSVRYRPG